MDTYTLELRQKEAQVIAKNGDYEYIVQEKILLEEGDSVVVKSVYIDTEASSNQKINVPHDLTLTMDYLKWWRYYFREGTGQIVAQGSVNYNIDPNGELYVICDGNINGQGAGDVLFSKELFFQSSGSGKFPASNFDLTINYKDYAGNPQVLRVHVPQINSPGFLAGQVVKLSKPLIWSKNGYTGDGTQDGLLLDPTPDAMASSYNTQFDSRFSEGGGNEVFVEPRQHTATIKIEAGAYSPVDMCNSINKQLTDFSSRSGSNPLYGNRIIQPETNYFSSYNANLVGTDVGNVPNVLSIEANQSPQLVGANQAELTYLDSVQKFAWNQLHTAYLDENGSPVIYYDSATGATRSAYSGISWTFLGAKRDDTGEEFDFWTGLLGFDLPKLYPTFELVFNDLINWRGSTATDMLRCNYTDGFEVGKQRTEGLTSVAPLVPSSKDTITASKGFAFPLTGQITNPTNGKNVIIEATNSVLSATSSFGYFLIEVNAKFNGKFVMKDQMKTNIRAIVGRFYEINSYTSGAEGDSLLYTHKGAPVFLDSFKCRILDSDKNLAQNLGEDNTIFLQVVKAPKQTDPQAKQSAVALKK
jgi:hypothetical protein